jgi:hypothetical protein
MEQEKKPFYKKWWVITLAVFFGIGFIGSLADKGSSVATQTTTNEQTTKNQQVVEKQYQEVFSFKGNGAKKSEPFTIQGDRFKIAYDCKGDPALTLCTAFVFKVGSSLPQAIMNSGQPIKDETVIYSNLAGRGEYYIDANVVGNFTMTVYDYK